MGDKDKSFTFLGWLGISDAPNWRISRPLGYAIGVFLIAVVPTLIFFALAAAFTVTFHTIKLGASGATEGINLGAGALIAALLGAPFLIWSTVLKHQTLRYQKEGHITDRISKSIEQLGAEKPVERIGRPVIIWTGTPSRIVCDEEAAFSISKNLRTKIEAKDKTQPRDQKVSMHDEETMHTASTWPSERTIIQWQDQNIRLDVSEVIGSEGPWQVFKETAPNIEVRVGAILSLERIAQDSTLFDNGRDHVRVMEVLCAYVRENTSRPSTERTFDEEKRFVPRTDVQVALDVIKRRKPEQIDLESAQRYRLDLRYSDFRGTDLSHGSFRGAILFGCRFEYANMRSSDFSGARFDGSVLNFVDCIDTSFNGAHMNYCRIDRPEPYSGGFVQSINMGNLTGVSLISANITSIQYLPEGAPTFGTKNTKLYWELDDIRRKVVVELHTTGTTTGEGGNENSDKQRDNYLEENFANWSPYDTTDLATSHLLKRFRRSLSLTGWPYDD